MSRQNGLNYQKKSKNKILSYAKMALTIIQMHGTNIAVKMENVLMYE